MGYEELILLLSEKVYVTQMEEAVMRENGERYFYLFIYFCSFFSQGSIFNNSLSGLMKYLKETPRRERLYWKAISL